MGLVRLADAEVRRILEGPANRRLRFLDPARPQLALPLLEIGPDVNAPDNLAALPGLEAMARQQGEGLVVTALLDVEQRAAHPDRIAVEDRRWSLGKHARAMGRVAELRVDFVEVGVQAVVAGSKLEGLRVEPRRCLSVAFDAPSVNAEVAIEHGIVEALAQ